MIARAVGRVACAFDIAQDDLISYVEPLIKAFGFLEPFYCIGQVATLNSAAPAMAAACA